MKLLNARIIAEKLLAMLEPHCEKIDIAGSIRRGKAEVKDIEIVAIPTPYESLPMFESGIATVVNRWQKVKGELPCKYTQRILPEGIKLDLFFAEPDNYGWIFAIRTGSADFSHYALAKRVNILKYTARDGFIYNQAGVRIPLPTEAAVFDLLLMPYIEPRDREIMQEYY